VCVSTLDLRDLNKVPGQLKNMFLSGESHSGELRGAGCGLLEA